MVVFFLCSSGQQQHFRPFFDTRFTGHLLELRRKSSDPFTAAAAAVANSSSQGKPKLWPFTTRKSGAEGTYKLSMGVCCFKGD